MLRVHTSKAIFRSKKACKISSQGHYVKAHYWILPTRYVVFVIRILCRTADCMKITENVAFVFFFQIWHFPPIFVLFKLIYLELAKFTIFLAFLINFCPLKMQSTNVARFARNV